MFSVFSMVTRPCYDVLTYVHDDTVLRLSCSWGNVSAGRWGTVEEGQSLQSNSAKCECALRLYLLLWKVANPKQ